MKINSDFNNFANPYFLSSKKKFSTINKEESILQEPKKNKIKNALFIASGLLVPIGVASLIYISKRKTPQTEKVSTYVKTIANAMSEYTNKEIDPKSLSCIISGNELKNELKFLKKENFVASTENIKNGTFLADLHSHSIFSDGKAEISTILDDVAKYADSVNKKTGKKFLYALTDHDTCKGVQEALKIISENPKKFKNVKFVTGAEISYAIKSDLSHNPFEVAEVLVYGFNPFDKKVTNFFDSITERRIKFTKNFIDDLNREFPYANFSIKEFTEIFNIELNKQIMHSQWNVHHYGQTKKAISDLALKSGKDKSELYKEIMSKTDPKKRALGNLRDEGLIHESYQDNHKILKLCKEKYCPNTVKGKINYASENNFVDIVNAFEHCDETFFSLSHPFYISQYTSKPMELIEELIKLSKGKIQATESFHQGYWNISSEKIDRYNAQIISKNPLLELGGRDNHKPNWLIF